MTYTGVYSLGLMSGTSMDGIDAAIIDTNGQYQIKSIVHQHFPYTKNVHLLLKSVEYTLQQAHGDMPLAEEIFENCTHQFFNQCLNIEPPNIIKKYRQISEIIELSTLLHAEAVRQLLKITPVPLHCIGYHGQTVFHNPKLKKTIQLGLGELLAQQTKHTVIYDFRSEDVALGGQGAPLAPIYHQALAVRDRKVPMGIINCGGLANITLVLGDTLNDLMGFDTGPGNCLLDAYIRKETKGREQMDKDGQYASKGKIHPGTLKLLQQKHPIIGQHQAFDSHDFHLIPELSTLSRADACATLVAFSVECIIQSLMPLTTQHALPQQYILCGGGAYHPGIRHTLEQRLKQTIHPNAQVKTANDIGWKSQAIEAELMAYLAVRRLEDLPTSLPKTTKVPYPISGGRVVSA